MQNKRRILLLILAPLVALALTACPVDPAEPPPQDGGIWDQDSWDEATWG